MALQFMLLTLMAAAGLTADDAWAGTLAGVTGAVGLALMAGGASLLALGSRDLGRNLTPVPRPRADARLVESGAYALARHPIYGGLIVAGLGWGLFTASPPALLLAFVLTGFFELKSRREEAWLVAHYPAYPAYMERTRRFIPYLY